MKPEKLQKPNEPKRLDKETLRLEYELGRKDIWERAGKTWSVHSILITRSLLAVLASFQYRDPLKKVINFKI